MNQPTSMNRDVPHVGIALPVYNGENYLREAIRSVLEQSFADFEMIISDNASTDRTGEICREAASHDPRVRYYRADVNRGLAWNFNHAFELVSCRYFMWMSHDDRLGLEYLARCVEAMDRDDGVVVCHTNVEYIDAQGMPIRREEVRNGAATDRPCARFKNLIRFDYKCNAIFGLMRRAVLEQTRLHGAYADSDRVLLAEMGLRGRFHVIPEYLFSRRLHALQVTTRYASRQERTLIFNPSQAGKALYPHVREFLELQSAVRRAPLSWRERLWCHWYMQRWLMTYRQRVYGDLVHGLKFNVKRFLKVRGG